MIHQFASNVATFLDILVLAVPVSVACLRVKLFLKLSNIPVSSVGLQSLTFSWISGFISLPHILMKVFPILLLKRPIRSPWHPGSIVSLEVCLSPSNSNIPVLSVSLQNLNFSWNSWFISRLACKQFFQDSFLAFCLWSSGDSRFSGLPQSLTYS